MLKQSFIILLLSIILGLGVNLVSPNKIPVIGKYRSLSSGDGPIIPPTADVNDPPFMAIDVAQMEHGLGNTLFIDARDTDEYLCGTIPGSVNLPFDYLPEDNLEHYIDSSLGFISKEQAMIIFCSGEECDLSLHLGRNLQAFDYTNVSIFFGGAREWEIFELEIERKSECAE